MTPKEALQRFVDFVNFSKIHEVSTFVFYGYEIEELQKFIKEHKKLQEFKATFDNYELAKKQDFIAYENWQECERELTELKRDVNRYFDLANNYEITEEVLDEFSKIRDKLLEVGNEDE